MTDETVTISKDEYHKLQVIADIMRRDYIFAHTSPTSDEYEQAMKNTASTAEWKAAIEDLDGLGS